MIIKESKLERTAFSVRELITDNVPKIAFIGRSNVGKSSLINKVLNRKKLAKISSKPGKTISVNYYRINNEFYFVDLPGYGFAKLPKSETQRVKELVSRFFRTVKKLELVFLLIDARRGFADADLEILQQMVEKNLKILTVLTKSDKMSSSNLLNQMTILQDKFGLKVIPFSTKLNNYREEILEKINQALME